MEKKVMAVKTQEIPEQKILKNKDPESKVYLLCISGKDFDIEDYIRGDWSESEYQTDNEIDSTFNMLGSDSRLSMTDFMNGNITTSSLEDDE